MRVPSRWGLGIAAISWATGWAGPATAAEREPSEGPRVELRFTGPEDCPASSLADAMDHLLAGSSSIGPIRVEATVDARVDATSEPTGERWSIVTTFDAGPGRSGSRTFHALSCHTVTRAAALAIVLAVDPTALDRLEGLEPVPEPEPIPDVPSTPEPPAMEPLAEPVDPLGFIVASEPEPEPEPGVADRTSAEPSSSWQGIVGMAGAIDGGALPGPGGGVVATIGAQRRHVRGELRGTYRFATRRASEADPRVGGAFSQWAVGVRGCGVLRPLASVELPLCLGLDGGQTVGRGVGLRAPRTSIHPWLAGVAEAGLSWPVRPWLALTLRAAVGVPILRQTFSITGLGVIHRVGPAFGQGLAGLELRFP